MSQTVDDMSQKRRFVLNNYKCHSYALKVVLIKYMCIKLSGNESHLRGHPNSWPPSFQMSVFLSFTRWRHCVLTASFSLHAQNNMLLCVIVRACVCVYVLGGCVLCNVYINICIFI